jgi:peptide/nickel transport system permease protein
MTGAASETERAEGGEGAAVERLSYFAIVWAELRKNRIAVLGMWCILGLFLVAVYAPLLAANQPILYDGGHGLSAPLFAALFNRLLFENAVDVFFNLLLVLSPLYAAIWFLARRRAGPERFRRARARLAGALAAFHLALFGLASPERLGPLENPLHRSTAIVDYKAEVAHRRAAGEHVTAVFPPLRYAYQDTDPEKSVSPPDREHPLGTDTEGRDVLSRMIYGTRISLTIGVVAVAIYVAIGVALGALAGYFGGWVDGAISRLIEVMICFPSFFLILTLAALVQERSIFHVMVIIGITSWTGIARLVRAEFLKHKNLEYAQAAVALGIPRRRIIFGHILPNAIAPVLVSATFGIASAILIESSLSFLGIGDVTVASWGETLNAGRIEGKLWLILAPGFAIFFVVTVFNLVGEGLRDALDPKLRT